jgi:hypothetical protein
MTAQVNVNWPIYYQASPHQRPEYKGQSHN